MAIRYESTEDGQIIESETPLKYLEGLARWVRTEIGALTSKSSPDDEAALAAAKAAADAAGNGGTPPAAPGERPKGNASREEWLAYASAQGTPAEDLAALSRDEIAAKFPATA